MQTKCTNRNQNSETDRDTNRRAFEQMNEETDNKDSWTHRQTDRMSTSI